MSKIVVIGSSNTDMVVKTSRFPKPGETILGGDFFMFSGGKGANQAVAAARLGGDVSFICSVGDDLFGQIALKGYQEEGIDISNCEINEGQASGLAMITVNAEGENQIVVASGANEMLSPLHLSRVQNLKSAEYLLTQLETPIECLDFLSQTVKRTGQKLILNPAPAQRISSDTLKELYLITPNETEAEILTGIKVIDKKSAELASKKLLDAGVKNVIITLGAQGAFFMDFKERFLVEGETVKAIDTTAAGDVFNGAITVGLSQGKSWMEAITFANKAAAYAVTQIGAQKSAPFLHELNLSTK